MGYSSVGYKITLLIFGSLSALQNLSALQKAHPVLALKQPGPGAARQGWGILVCSLPLGLAQQSSVLWSCACSCCEDHTQQNSAVSRDLTRAVQADLANLQASPCLHKDHGEGLALSKRILKGSPTLTF